MQYDPQDYYESVILKDDIDPSDPRGVRRKGALQHLEMLEEMVDFCLSDKEDIFVGEWSVSSEFVYHRHLELGTYTTFNGHDREGIHPICPGHLMPSTAWEAFIMVWVDDTCTLCGEKMPEEVYTIYRMFD